MRSLSRRLLRASAAALALVAFAACGDDEPTRPLTLSSPANLQAATTTSQVTLTWTAVNGADGYIVQRATGATGGTFVQVGGQVSGTNLVDDAVTEGSTYRYRVAAIADGRIGAFSAEQTVAIGTAGPKARTISGNITTSVTLYADTVYTLSGFVKVANGATLTIQPGTKIVGSLDVPGSALFILRGARIVANGTAAAPIVMTSARADGDRAPGDWGGLVVVGNARINRTGDVIIEGSDANRPNGGAPGVVYSNGAADDDSSGVLRYVRVEFAGFGVAQDQELNAFTFAAVGSRTRMEYLQALAGLDDHFEWFGGSVDAKYLVSYEAADDHFDSSEGHRGRNQFMIGYQTRVLPPRPGTGQTSGDPQGFEVDGCAGVGCTDLQNSAPFNMPVFANFTMIGPGQGVLPASGGVGMVLRRGTGGTYVNGIVGRYTVGLSVRDAASNQRRLDDSLTIRNVLFAENVAHLDPSATNFTQPAFFVGSGIDSVSGANSARLLFVSVPPTGTLPSTATLDWTPANGSAATSGGLNAFTGVLAARAGTFITPTTYRGAVDPAGAKWWQGWTVYDQN